MKQYAVIVHEALKESGINFVAYLPERPAEAWGSDMIFVIRRNLQVTAFTWLVDCTMDSFIEAVANLLRIHGDDFHVRSSQFQSFKPFNRFASFKTFQADAGSKRYRVPSLTVVQSSKVQRNKPLRSRWFQTFQPFNCFAPFKRFGRLSVISIAFRRDRRAD